MISSYAFPNREATSLVLELGSRRARL